MQVTVYSDPEQPDVCFFSAVQLHLFSAARL